MTKNDYNSGQSAVGYVRVSLWFPFSYVYFLYPPYSLNYFLLGIKRTTKCVNCVARWTPARPPEGLPNKRVLAVIDQDEKLLTIITSWDRGRKMHGGSLRRYRARSKGSFCNLDPKSNYKMKETKKEDYKQDVVPSTDALY